ncbi:putative acetyltransferase [Synechococcus sp. MIT S9220]|nr:putative acetyltransferase [Synechococcus sp. MIT S9220]
MTATNWAFESLDLFKITAGIYTNNIGSLKAFQKAGFHVESVSKLEALFCNSRVDVISLAKFSSG